VFTQQSLSYSLKRGVVVLFHKFCRIALLPRVHRTELASRMMDHSMSSTRSNQIDTIVVQVVVVTLKGFSPECCRMCVRRMLDAVNALPQ